MQIMKELFIINKNNNIIQYYIMLTQSKEKKYLL